MIEVSEWYGPEIGWVFWRIETMAMTPVTVVLTEPLVPADPPPRQGIGDDDGYV